MRTEQPQPMLPTDIYTATHTHACLILHANPGRRTLPMPHKTHNTTNKTTNTTTNKTTNERTNKQTNEQTNEQTNQAAAHQEMHQCYLAILNAKGAGSGREATITQQYHTSCSSRSCPGW